MYVHSNNASEIDRLTRKVEVEKEKTDLLLELKATSKKTERLKDLFFAGEPSEMIKRITRLLEKDYIIVDSLTPDTIAGE